MTEKYKAAAFLILTAVGCWLTAATLADVTHLRAVPACLIVLGGLSFLASSKIKMPDDDDDS